jgi:cytochrome c biogenesis protein CcdA
MSTNRTPFVFKAMFLVADVLSVSVIVMALYLYAFQVVDQYGYAIDGVATVVVVIAGIFGLVANRFNRKEAMHMHR